MPTLDQWKYVALPGRGLAVTGILRDDSRRHLTNGQQIYTNTVISVGIQGNCPVARTKSGTIYRLLNPSPDPTSPSEP